MFVTTPILFASDLLGLTGVIVLYALCVVVPIVLLAWLFFYLLSQPMRRQERGRFFLDLLATILSQGKPLEQSLIEISNNREKTLGIRFHIVTGYLERGLQLGGALQKVPRFLSPQVAAMLRAGEELGDIRKVLPVCDYLAKDAQSNVRGAISYLVVIAFALSPCSLFVLNTLAVIVFPKFKEVLIGMPQPGEHIAPTAFGFLEASLHWLILAQAVLFTGLLIAMVFYIGGPWLARSLQSPSFPFIDWIAWHVSWKRRRLLRNFSQLLAILLDNGMPEASALRLAGESITNEILHRRVARAQIALANGTKLTDAVALLDDSGEFRWRLTNAIHAHGGFLRALTGWHESLDAKAFQQEQTAAHSVTSALVVANGAIVAIVAIGVFSALIAIVNTVALW